MDWLDALILGLIQGLTEFLPVSSSAHLTIGRELLGVGAAEDLVFETAVHAATVLATIVVFRKPIWDLLKGLFRFKYNDQTDYILKICVSMIPVFIVGMFFKDEVEALFSSLKVVGVALLVTSLLGQGVRERKVRCSAVPQRDFLLAGLRGRHRPGICRYPRAVAFRNDHLHGTALWGQKGYNGAVLFPYGHSADSWGVIP